MTVNELIKSLQEMQAQGKGDYTCFTQIYSDSFKIDGNDAIIDDTVMEIYF